MRFGALRASVRTPSLPERKREMLDTFPAARANEA
jgi:hypothetical protein